MKMEVKNGFSESERKKKTQRGRKLRGKKKTEVAERKEEREIEKEKGGEIKYNYLKSIEGIIIVKFERILFILLSFLLK
jgi:hypothetical protein